jgi:hypothetical protein
MQQTIKKPQQVTVCQYMSCIGILNNYLPYLPMDYDLSMAVEGMKKSNVLLNEADLAGIVLSLVPVTWVNQYNMLHSMLPKSPRALLPNLEAIEQVLYKKHQASLKAKAKEVLSASASTKGGSKKGSASRNPPRPGKFCQCSKIKGGPHLTHNTNKCCKYNKDDNPVATANVKPSDAKKPFKKGGKSRWLI